MGDFFNRRRAGRPGAQNWNEATLTSLPVEVRQGRSERSYLVVFEQGGCSTFPLPSDGEVVIGRGETTDLRLDDSSVSRRHARIVLARGEAIVSDLGSRNGTRVNGERATEARRLVSGDLVVLGSVTLAFHTSTAPAVEPSLLGLAALRRRVAEELERSVSFQRPFALLALEPVGEADLAQLGATLRLMDVVARDGTDRLVILMPETSAEAARLCATGLIQALGSRRARAGFAAFPADGYAVDDLLGGAVAALSAAPAGEVAAAAEASATLEIGNRKIVVADPVMSRLYTLVDRLAAVDLPVLVSGETGTGKEVVAMALHQRSARRDRPFVAVNCAAIQDNLLESELFGYEKGAFTGAASSKPGLLETAAGGILFLDEIAEMSASAQAKLLRVLETKRLTRLGDVRERDIDVRVIAATNRKLDADVRAGRFRQDLFFRLSGAMLWLPPLRDRPRELRLLCRQFLEEACTHTGRPALGLSEEALGRLEAHPWPGNVRELKNLMEYLAATMAEPEIQAWHFEGRLDAALGAPLLPEVLEPARPAAPAAEAGAPLRPMGEEIRTLERNRMAAALAGGVPPPPTATPAPPQSSGSSGPPAGRMPAAATPLRRLDDEIRELERSRMATALEATGGNRTHAAELIGMPLRTFLKKLKQYDLTSPADSRRKR